VVALYRNTAHDLQTLEVVGDLGQSVQIVATDEHPFYVVDVGWTTADAVQVGQKLVGAGGAVLTIVANRDWKPDGGVVVYNFQVEGDHTYFVGDIHAQGEWVWTHNACTPSFRAPQSLEERGLELVAKNGGRHRVSISTPTGRINIDLAGRTHGPVATPHIEHFKNNIITRGERAGQIGNRSQVGDTVRATFADLRLVSRYLDSLRRQLRA
jgi:hypothetical protein